MSLAVLRCPGLSRPAAHWKVVPVIPSSRAFWFIIWTKASSLPATYSARQTVASLALAMATALRRSFTVISSPGSSQIWLPP